MTADQIKKRKLRKGGISAFILLVMMVLVGFQMLRNWNDMDIPAQMVFLAWFGVALYMFQRSVKRLAALFADLVPEDETGADRYTAQTDTAQTDVDKDT